MPLLPLKKDLLLLLLEMTDTALGVAAVGGTACCFAAPEGLVAQRHRGAAWLVLIAHPPLMADAGTIALMLRSEANLLVDITIHLVDMFGVQTIDESLAV